MPGIIVGVDGSSHSRRALGWAMREAAFHHVPLTVITVHPPAVRPATRIYWAVPSFPENSFNPDLAQRTVQEFVDDAASEISGRRPRSPSAWSPGTWPKNSSGPRVTPT